MAAQAIGPMRQVEQARALAGRGLDGDRYAAKAGTFTPASDTARGYDLTLIQAEVLDQLALLTQAITVPITRLINATTSDAATVSSSAAQASGVRTARQNAPGPADAGNGSVVR